MVERQLQGAGTGLDQHVNVTFALETALGPSASPLMWQHLAPVYCILLSRCTSLQHAGLLHALLAAQHW